MLSDCPKCDGEGSLLTSPPELAGGVCATPCPDCKGACIVMHRSPRCEICLAPGATPGRTLQGEKMLCDDCERTARRARVEHQRQIEASRAERDCFRGV